MTRPQMVELQLPPVLSLGPDDKPVHKPRGTIRVYHPGKAPKLRFQPGSFFELGGQLYRVIYAYRVVNERDWLYCCEFQVESESGQPRPDSQEVNKIPGEGDHTPRFVKQLFKNNQQAWDYFRDIPVDADRKIFRNGDLMGGRARVVNPIIMPPPKRKALE